jgi:hypothetical protein
VNATILNGTPNRSPAISNTEALAREVVFSLEVATSLREHPMPAPPGAE